MKTWTWVVLGFIAMLGLLLFDYHTNKPAPPTEDYLRNAAIVRDSSQLDTTVKTPVVKKHRKKRKKAPVADTIQQVNATTPLENSIQQESNYTPSHSSSSYSGESVQCSGTTKKGARCRRMTTNPSGRCWQH